MRHAAGLADVAFQGPARQHNLGRAAGQVKLGRRVHTHHGGLLVIGQEPVGPAVGRIAAQHHDRVRRGRSRRRQVRIAAFQCAAQPQRGRRQ
ncbi:hypothetical protein G6F60_015347 [Rhizopus arrhizus]|nr:hypothetical protein G6F60_015347 [Rhizopus arrhizus]